MTDKQIINEIDIGKCEFCDSGEYCHIYSGTADFRWFCEENEDCQIKNLLLQLKAKEQECKALREEKAYTDMACEQFEKQLKAKEQECEQQKAKLELFKTSNQTTIDQLKGENETLFKAIEEVNKINKRLEAENEELKKINKANAKSYEKHWHKLEKYKQALAEIKKVAEETINSSDCYKRMYGGMCARPILQKISELENEKLNIKEYFINEKRKPT